MSDEHLPAAPDTAATIRNIRIVHCVEALRSRVRVWNAYRSAASEERNHEQIA